MKGRRRHKGEARRWLHAAAAAGAVLAVARGVRFLQGRGRPEPEWQPPVRPRVPEPAVEPPTVEPPTVEAPPEAPAVEIPEPAPEPPPVEAPEAPMEPPPVEAPPPRRPVFEILEKPGTSGPVDPLETIEAPALDEPPETPPEPAPAEVPAEAEAVRRPRKGRWWLTAAALAAAAAVTFAGVDFGDRSLPPLDQLSRKDCRETARWLSSLSTDVRTELLKFDRLFVFGSDADATYLTPSAVYGDVIEVYAVGDDVDSAGLISNGSNWPEGLSVSTDGDNFSCSVGAGSAGDCVAHEELLDSLPKSYRSAMYRGFDRLEISLLSESKARVVAYAGAASESFIVTPGDVRPDPQVGRVYVYAPGPTLDVELAGGRARDRSC